MSGRGIPRQEDRDDGDGDSAEEQRRVSGTTLEKVKDIIIEVSSPIEPLARKAYDSPPVRWFRENLSSSEDAREHRQIRAVIKGVLANDFNCVDVGTHRGELLRTIVRFAPTGTHYAFEPIPSLYQDLIKSFPAARVYQIALSDEPGITTFYYVPRYSAFSGLRQRPYPSDNIAVRQIEVRQDTLDDIVNGEVPIHFIKIDVEGAEFNVLKGAASTIRTNKPIIIFEHELAAIEQYGHNSDEVYELLSDYGLHVSLIGDWLQNRKALDQQDFVEHVKRRTKINFIAYP